MLATESAFRLQDAKTEAVGTSQPFRHLMRMVDRLAATDRTLLISGPSGSGKEIVARQVHLRSQRAAEPFVDVNGGAIPENLVEAELFGHAKGAFTGAIGNRAGYFQLAGRGTLFLDEIGELPLSLQPKLLRVLETRTFRPVGASEPLRFDGRVVAATHRDLLDMVKQGKFREDLYYRLAVFVLELPGLDQRIEDIPALVAHFCSLQTRKLVFTPAAIKRLCEHTWPGHVRQLRNIVDRVGVLADTSHITVEVLEPFLTPIKAPALSQDSLADSLMQLEGEDKLAAAESLLIDRALARASGNKTAAAQLLGVSRKAIERRLKAREDRGHEAKQCLNESRKLVDDSQFAEAIPLLERCLNILAQMAGGEEIRRLQFEAYRLLSVSLRIVHGWLCEEVRTCYQSALKIGEGVCEPEELASVHFGIWTTQIMALEMGHARSTAQAMLVRAHGAKDRVFTDDAHVAMANTLYWLGDSEEALACLARGGLLRVSCTDERIGRQGFDLMGLALMLEGLAAFQTGSFIQARQAMETLIERTAAGSRNSLNRVIALQGAAWLATLFEETERVGAMAAEMESLSNSLGFAFYQGVALILRGWHLGAVGEFAAGERAIADGYEKYILRHGGRMCHSWQAWLRGEWLLRAGRPADCEELVSRAHDLSIELQERAYLAELLHVKARALLAQADREGAEQALRSAISTAQALGAIPARIEAAFHLAALLRGSGRATQASALLSRELRDIHPDALSPCVTRARKLQGELQS